MSAGKTTDHNSVKLEVKAGDHDEHKDVPGLDEDHAGVKTDFKESHGITTAEADELRLKWGRNELPEKKTPKWLIFCRGLWGPMPIMIWCAAIVELALENWADGGILLGILIINASISYYETTKAGDAVAALKASLRPVATCKRDGKWQNLDAALLVPGDLVLLASGSAVPADCLVNHGTIDVDQAALTGESLPVTMTRGCSAKMGSNVVRGEVEGTVEFTGENTFFGKTASLLGSVDGHGNLQKLLLKVMFILVVLSLTLCFTAFGYLMGEGEDVRDALSFTVVLLVASIPVAIEIVVTTTLALGSRQLSVHGAIVTRLASIEELAGMNILCSDKTGTLTLNKMMIQDYTPVFTPGMDRAKILILAALAAKWREPPRDALDTMVLGAADLDECDKYTQLEFVPFDPTTKKTSATIKGPDGKTFSVCKGAPHVVLKMCHNKEHIEHGVEAIITDLGQRGIRCLTVARTNDDGLWEMAGILTFLDPPRPDTKHTCERAMEFGVDVKMITGDHKLIAIEMSKMIGLGANVMGSDGLPMMEEGGKIPEGLGEKYGDMVLAADGFAQVFPEHKFLIVEALRQRGFGVGMTGDGVNDAPALKRADVGIAVQGATDAARAAADIVLTQPGLSIVVDGIIIARQIFQRMKSFLTYRISATLQLLVFFFIAVFAFIPANYQLENSKKGFSSGTNRVNVTEHSFGGDRAKFFEFQAQWKQHARHHKGIIGENTEAIYWPHFFSLPVLMLMLITLLNDGTLITIGYDNATASSRPEKWNVPALFLIATVLGGIACISSLLMVWACLDSYNPNGLFRRWGLPPMEYSKIVTGIYLQVSVLDFLTLFSARVHEDWFWKTIPSRLLGCGATLSLGLTTLLACLWPDGKTDGKPTKGLARGEYRLWPLWIWIYCIICWLIQDACKVGMYKLMIKYDILKYRSAILVNARGNLMVNRDIEAHIGSVEAKVLSKKLEHVAEAVDKISKTSGVSSKNLNRVSQNLALVRKSLTGPLAQDTMRSGAMNPEAVDSVMKEVDAHLATSDGTPEDIAAARVRMEEARAAAVNMARVSAMLSKASSRISAEVGSAYVPNTKP